MPLFLSGWSPTTCDHTAPRSGILGSNAGTSAGFGRTVEPRIHISRRGGGSARWRNERSAQHIAVPDAALQSGHALDVARDVVLTQSWSRVERIIAWVEVGAEGPDANFKRDGGKG